VGLIAAEEAWGGVIGADIGAPHQGWKMAYRGAPAAKTMVDEAGAAGGWKNKGRALEGPRSAGAPPHLGWAKLGEAEGEPAGGTF
jgi:hypothetical protein